MFVIGVYQNTDRVIGVYKNIDRVIGVYQNIDRVSFLVYIRILTVFRYWCISEY